MVIKENRSIKYRIYPNKEQSILINKTFGCARKIYNLMLADKKKSYEETQKFGKQTPAMYKTEYPYLKEVDSLALANAQLHLQAAMKNCFQSKHCNFPVFKSKRNRQSYTTNNQHGTVAIVGNTVKLPKIGRVKAKLHRLPKEDWILKSATISKDSDDKYYASLLFVYEKEMEDRSLNRNNAIGLDYKSDGLYMASDGTIGSNHKFYRESHAKLAKAQRKLSRKIGNQKGEAQSNNYKKQLKKVAKIHKHISNQRLDNLHKLSTEITNRYDIVCVESLNMKSISNKGFRNGKATMDNGYGLFLTLLEYKLKSQNKKLIKVDKWYPSSQLCFQCGKRHKMPLSVRTYKCECGYICDRDLNAAKNILREGLTDVA